MSQSVTTVGCPRCGTSTSVPLPPKNEGELMDENRLKGHRIDCNSCGTDFSFYYY